MKLNKLVEICLIVCVVLLCLNVAAASDLNESHVVEADNDNGVVENSISDNLGTSDNEDSLSAGNSWYVKAGSSGGNGSQGKPYGDLKSALDNPDLAEGDTIYVIGGTAYKGTSNTGLTIDKNNLTIVSSGSKVPEFNGDNQRQIFKITGDNIVLKGLKLTKGNAANGAALYIDSDNICIDGCTITSNTATTNGGGVYIADHANVSIIGSKFTSNKATSMGAGIYNLANNTLIANCYFYNDIAANGGGIYSSNKIKIINSNISSCKNNKVKTFGGGILLYTAGASGSVLNNVIFASCFSDRGGSIALVGCNNISVNDCEIKNSWGCTNGYTIFYSTGAAIWTNGANNIFNNTYIHDSQGYNYGVVYISSTGENTTFDNCNFSRNLIDTIGHHGGAIFSSASRVIINNSYFGKNHCSEDGGAIAINGGNNVLIENSEFYRNYAARGGAIYYFAGAENSTIYNCIFKGNGVFPAVLGDNVTKGGAIFSNSSNLNISESYFEGNVGLSSGAIQLTGNYNNIERCTFKDNIANHYGGGAISSGSISDNVTDCEFTGNTAKGYGGAISMNYVTVKDSVFTDNMASLGGAIYTINATVSGCEFNNNIAEKSWVVVAEDKLQLSDNKNLEELITVDDLLCASIEQIPVQFGHEDVINATYNTSTNESHVDGYNAYCVESLTDAPTFGVLRDDLMGIKNSITEESVGEYLKLLVYYHFDDTVSYKDFQTLVNIFSDQNYIESDDAAIQDVIARYDAGERIPDVLIEKHEDGTLTQYLFKSLIVPQATQNLLLFNIRSYKPNMSVEKIALDNISYIGKETTFVINVTNTGDFRLTNVTVAEDIPEGLRYDGDFSGVNWTNEGNKFIYNGILQPGESVTFNITLIATATGTWTNRVNVSSNETENKTANNNTTVYKPGLEVEKITLTSVVKVGSLTSFKITVTNTGDCDLGDVFVVEKSYEGLVYHSYEGGEWSKDGDVFKYSGVLKPGESASFTIFFNTTKEGNFLNVVIAGSNLTDNETAQNSTEVLGENETSNSTDDDDNSSSQVPEDVPENVTGEVPENVTDDVADKIVKTNAENATGNPLFALLAVLLTLCGFGIRKFK